MSQLGKYSSLTSPVTSITGGDNITAVTVAGNATISVSGTTDHALQVGNASGSLTSLALGLADTVLLGNGAADPAWSTATYPAATTQGDVIYSSADNTIVGLAKDATATRYISNTGAANNPAWAQVALTNGVTGILPVANGGTGLNSLAVAKTIYVTKSGNDGNVGTDINHAFLTIQAAVTAAIAGDTILVYPGTYTETVTHAANDVSVFAMGDSTNCIIQNTDANVIDFGAYTGIVYKFFRIQVTAATTAINTVQGTTGSCVFNDCFLRMGCAADIVAATQPSVASITGAGSINITLGFVDYFHTGNCGGTALKSALLVADGGLIEVHRNSDMNITCSGTALASSLAIDRSATGNINIYNSMINVTDPDATIVAGLGYLGGVGAVHEYFRNNVCVIGGAANAGYGFYAGDTASVSRFFYNHINVTNTGGTSYSYFVGATATVISQFDDIIAADGVSLNPAGFYYEVSSEANGNLSLLGPAPSLTRTCTVANTDNTATASNAAVQVSVGGTTSTGDPYVNFLVAGAGTYSVGIDNTVAGDPLKITSGATPSAGTDLLTMTSAGVITLHNDLDVTEGGTGVGTLTSHGLLLGNGTGDIQALAEASDGQIPIGSTGNNPVLATLTAGDGIGITNAAGSITVSSSGGGFEWSVVTTGGTAADSQGYFTNDVALVAVALPSTAPVGHTFSVAAMSAGGFSVTQGAGQYIQIGNDTTTVGAGGSLSSTNIGDWVTLVCCIANATWMCKVEQGNITVV